MASHPALVEWLYARAQAARWGVSREEFAAALERSAGYRFSTRSPSTDELENYLRGLHVEDLSLARALMADAESAGSAERSEAAWEHFVKTYRGALYAAARAITGRSGAESRELADSLYADLYGVDARGRKRESLFRYYHGRSKLSTWLRAILAQRHVDAIRAARRLEPIEDETVEESARTSGEKVSGPLADPNRERYLALLREALEAALAALEPRDRLRLSLYYAEGVKLAQIGRQLGEHEATVSRHLERIRRALREKVACILRAGKPAVDGARAQPGLSDAQIELCFEYALEDWPFDLRVALDKPGAPGEKAEERRS